MSPSKMTKSSGKGKKVNPDDQVQPMRKTGCRASKSRASSDECEQAQTRPATRGRPRAGSSSSSSRPASPTGKKAAASKKPSKVPQKPLVLKSAPEVKETSPEVDVGSTSLPVSSRTRASIRILQKNAMRQLEANKAKNRDADPERDPITLEDLGSCTWTFEYASSNPERKCSSMHSEKSKTVYNVDSLVGYLLQSGNFTDTITRLPYSLSQIEDLQKVAIEAGVKGASGLVYAYEVRGDPNGIYGKRKEIRELLTAYDICTSDCIARMRHAIEATDAARGQNMLINEFREFEGYFFHLWSVDPEFCRQCITAYKHALSGPPNKPTKNVDGRLQLAINFLTETAARNTNRI